MSTLMTFTPGELPQREIPTVPFAPRRVWLWATIVCLCAAVLMFWLPLSVPLKPLQTMSDSFDAGFSNPVAVVCGAGLSVLVLLCTLWARRSATPAPLRSGSLLDEQFTTLAAVVLSAIVLTLEGWAAAASHLRYIGDAGYFIEQATVRRDTGRALYTQLEFAYGPLLLLPEVWLSKALHCSMQISYYTLLVVESTVGLLLLVYVLDRLPITASVRKIGFLLFAVGELTPHLGLNYTYIRFVAPYALLLFASGSGSLARTVFWLTAGDVVLLFVSPELGMALAVGIAVFGLVRAWQSGWSWLLAAVVPLAVLGILLLTLGRPFLIMASSFSGGALNLPVGPYPHIAILLFALVWLVPFGLGRVLDLRDPVSARLLAVYATALAFLPAALGRCDPLHVFFNGTGLFLLALVVISQSTPRARVGWLTAFAALVLWSQFVNQRFFQVRTTYVLVQTVMPHLPVSVQKSFAAVLAHRGPTFSSLLTPQPETSYHLDTAALERLVGAGCVTTPVYVSPTVETELKETHHYSPGFYGFWIDMMNPVSEGRSIREISQCPWMLLPTGFTAWPVPLNTELADVQGYHLPYKLRHLEGYRRGAILVQDLHERWRAVRSFGPYTLYRQVVPLPGLPLPANAASL